MSSVARKPSHATDDIINYNKKKNNYRKELKELAATNIAEAADDAGPPRAPRAGSLASSENLIRAFLKRKGVTAVDKGVNSDIEHFHLHTTICLPILQKMLEKQILI